MSDDRGDEGGSQNWRDQRAHQLRGDRRERERFREQGWEEFIERLGYNPNDIEELREDLRFARRQRKRSEKIESSKLGWVISFVFIVMGAMVTAVVQWFSTKVGK